jgi:hypothetical protein
VGWLPSCDDCSAPWLRVVVGGFQLRCGYGRRVDDWRDSVLDAGSRLARRLRGFFSGQYSCATGGSVRTKG